MTALIFMVCFLPFVAALLWHDERANREDILNRYRARVFLTGRNLKLSIESFNRASKAIQNFASELGKLQRKLP